MGVKKLFDNCAQKGGSRFVMECDDDIGGVKFIIMLFFSVFVKIKIVY